MTNVRMSIDVSEELHRRLKTYCAAKSETIRDYVVGAITDKLKKQRVLKPERMQALRDSDNGIGLNYYDSLEDMYKDLGI